MKNENTRASGVRNYAQRLAALGAALLLVAALTACGGGGGGGATGPSGPVTPTSPVVTPTTPVVTPTVPVVPPTVSVICPNTNPVVVVQGSNANDYSNCPPPVIVTPVITWGSVTAAVTPVAMNVKTFIASSANNGSGVGQIAATCTDVTSQCYLNALTTGVVKRISTTALMTGGSINPTAPVEFHYYKIQSGPVVLSCAKPIYAANGTGIGSNSATIGCNTGVADFARTNPQGIERRDTASGLCFQLAFVLTPVEAWVDQPGATCAP